MIIHNTNILAVPLMLLVWCIDVYLFLCGLRLILGQLKTSRGNEISLGLQHLTDPLPVGIGRLLSARRSKPVPAWLPWLIVFVAGYLLHHLLIWLVIKMH